MECSYEQDKIKEELVKADVKGRVFEFQEMTNKEYYKMKSETSSINAEEGTVVIDWEKRDNHYLLCVKKAPYKEWDALAQEARLGFLQGLKMAIRIPLLNEIKRYHTELSDVEKK